MSVFNLMSKIEMITEEGEVTFGLIQDIVGNRLYVSMPPDDRRFKLLQIEDKIKCIVYDKNKVLGFDGVVLNRISGITPVYEIFSYDNFETIQRREFVRVKTTIPLIYTDNKYLINTNFEDHSKIKGKLENMKKYLKDGMISNISGGGLKFSCNENLRYVKLLLLVFELSNDIFVLKGEIVYKDINTSSNKTVYNYGVKFIDISEKTSEKIIRYVFQLMRKNKIR